MNCFSKHNKTLKKTELLRVNLMHLLAAFELLYYCAALWKRNRFNVLNDIQACRYLVKDFGTSQSPKSTRQRDNHCAPAALRTCRFATPTQHSLKWLDAIVRMPTLFILCAIARRINSAA